MRLKWPILTLLPVSLALVAPASADEQSVSVDDYLFAFPGCPDGGSRGPCVMQIQPGDTVNWTFVKGGHTTTARRDQPEFWNSRERDAGGSFSHTFERPGKYQYICLPHRPYMKGVIQVGEDEVADTFDDVKTRPTARGARITFVLGEPAVVSYDLRGPTRKRVAAERLETGTHIVKVGKLKAGRYRGTLTFQDDFDKKTTARNSFVIR